MMYHIHIDIEIESDVIDKFELEGQLERLSTDSLVEAGYLTASAEATIEEE